MRRALVGAVALLTFAAAPLAAQAQTSPSQSPTPSSSGSPCDGGGIAGALCNIVGGLLSGNPLQTIAGGGQALGGAAGSLATGVADDWFTAMMQSGAKALANAATAAAGWLSREIDAATDPAPTLHAPWFLTYLSHMRQLGVALLYLLYLLAIIWAVLRRSGRELARAPGVAFFAVLAMFFAPALIDIALQLVDALCSLVVQLTGTGSTLTSLGQGIGNVAGSVVTLVNNSSGNGVTAGGVYVGVALIVALIAAIAFGLVFLNLFVRKYLIVIIVSFLSLGFATAVHPKTARAYKRVLKLLSSVILSKLIVVLVISIGAALMSSALSGQPSTSDVIAGVAVVFVAAVAPWAVSFLVPLAAMEGIHMIHGARRQASRPLDSGAAKVNQFDRIMRQKMQESAPRNNVTSLASRRAGQGAGGQAAGKAAGSKAAAGAGGGAAAGTAAAGAATGGVAAVAMAGTAAAKRTAGASRKAASSFTSSAASTEAPWPGGAQPLGPGERPPSQVRSRPPGGVIPVGAGRKGDPDGHGRTPSGLIVKRSAMRGGPSL